MGVYYGREYTFRHFQKEDYGSIYQQICQNLQFLIFLNDLCWGKKIKPA